jgi:hypothetical protein
MSKRARLQGIRGSRQAERDREREANAWNLAANDPTDPSPTGDKSERFEEQEYVPPPQDVDGLRKLREERLKNER